MTSILMLIAFYQHNIRGLLHTLLYRTYNTWSNYFQIHEEINHLKSACQKNCIHKFLNKLLVKGVRDSTTTQKKEITISLEYLGKISLLAKKKTFLEVVTNILNLTSFSKHQIDSATHLDLNTTYLTVLIQ